MNNDQFDCSDYSAFNDLKLGQTILKVPCRSPLAVVEKIKPYIKNKVVCELGSAVGDIALEMAKYAKKVIGVEIDEECVRISRKRGLYTICADVSNLPSLPEKIDVTYMWMDHKITRKVFDSIKNGLIIVAGELGYGAKRGYVRGVEVKVLDEIRDEYPQSQMHYVSYNERERETVKDNLAHLFCLLLKNNI